LVISGVVGASAFVSDVAFGIASIYNPHSADIKENLGIKNSQKQKPEKIA
jgi:hypothetical protein